MALTEGEFFDDFVSFGINDVECLDPLTGDIEVLSIWGDAKTHGAIANRNLLGDFVGFGINDEDVAFVLSRSIMHSQVGLSYVLRYTNSPVAIVMADILWWPSTM